MRPRWIVVLLMMMMMMSVMWPGTRALAQARPEAVETVSGRVFQDANANSRLDLGEKGVPGVRVTDGVNFVTTGDDGSYKIKLTADLMLPFPGTQGVAVCWPSGKWPAGRHWMRVKDMPDPSNMNFGLRDDIQKLPFVYLHVTDSHDWRASRYEHQHESVNKVLKEARFIVHTGDMSLGGPDPEGVAKQAEYLLGSQAKCLMPTFTAIGNHDTDAKYPADPSLDFCGAFAKFIGPLRFSFDYAGVRFTFVDVIGDARDWNDFTAAWLEKDFASLNPGARIIMTYHYPNPESSERFLKLIRDRKVELIHAGHSHAYTRWPDFAAPMVTAYARSSGTANVMVTDTNTTHVAVFCDGCSSGAGSHSFKHSARCPVAWRGHVLEPGIKGLYGGLHEAKDLALAGDAKPVAVSTDAVYVQAEIDPGTARSVGIRIGEGGKSLDVSFGGGHITVDGVACPFLIPAHDKTLKLYAFAHKDMLTVWANECFFFEKPVKFQRAGQVQAFASGGKAGGEAGGKAAVKSLAVQEIKPDPANRNRTYFCGCAHGAVMRNPE